MKSVNLAVPDVTLRLDIDGVIREANLANSVSDEAVNSWVGRPWMETVGDTGGVKVLQMVADARANGVSDFGQLTQCFPSGLELPMEYNTVRLGGKAGLIAIGRNLRTVAGVQARLVASRHERELDAWRLRAGARGERLLFESSADPVLRLRSDDLRIMDANPAAIRAGALDAGRDFPTVVAPADRDAFRAMMASVGEQGRAPGILLHLGASSAPWLVRASVATSEPEMAFLVQLAPLAAIPSAQPTGTALDGLIERLPDAFVLVDAAGIIRRVNRAFLDLVQVVAPGGVIGQAIGRWLSRPGADAAVLLANVSRHRMVRGFSTSIQGELGIDARVEISATGDRDRDPRRIVMLLRDVSRRWAGDGAPGKPDLAAGDRLLGPLTELTQRIGRTPLLQLVRDAGSMLERHCIEGALERASGNRTAAAEMLGLSRQSLYIKMNRYGIGGIAEDQPAVK